MCTYYDEQYLCRTCREDIPKRRPRRCPIPCSECHRSPWRLWSHGMRCSKGRCSQAPDRVCRTHRCEKCHNYYSLAAAADREKQAVDARVAARKEIVAREMAARETAEVRRKAAARRAERKTRERRPVTAAPKEKSWFGDV
ncbi:hypothetical protein S40285_10157 [Stachybotrys chlorohalonatus IBT 40285]|uniref:Uncharacterized protein n=1 Tax=Stachybotrys chlorohalonatus (strain IBT 40285) TaxID=1283841 RepID=A0A084QL07_STAC4|nr:hypothetical protein S40285_10157 [Stachybotrys chlorohalonata IBT 40285]